MVNTSIWATNNDSFDLGCRVVKWDEPEGFDFSKTWKYVNHNTNDIKELRKKITQLTVHWSATYKAAHMYNGLIARGLSVNFMIDDDETEDGFATIYQCLPISKCGYSQGKYFNALGPGIEISYQPALWEDDKYDANDRKKWKVPEHTSTKGKVHGVSLSVHLPTEAQMKSLKVLCWGFGELFPDVPMTFPRDGDDYNLTVLKEPTKYVGLCNHYNLKRGKIDTAGLDLKGIEDDIKELKSVGYNIFRKI